MCMEKEHKEATKRIAVNLTISEHIVNQAKELGMNASRAAEEGIWLAVKKAKEEQWLEENKLAIEAQERYIENHGVPLRPK